MVDELVLESLTLRLKDADVEVTGGQSSEFIPLENIRGRVLGTSKDNLRVQIGWRATRTGREVEQEPPPKKGWFHR